MKIAILVVVSLIAVGFAYLSFSDDVKIDGCLDHGGAWDYERRICYE
jgi:hypothetical protein